MSASPPPPAPLTVSIIGDGAMATVCAQILAGKADPEGAGTAPCVTLDARVWGRDPARLASFDAARENTRYLPGIKLHRNVHFTPDPRQFFAGSALIVCAIPTQYIRTTLQTLRPHVPPAVPVLSVAKGIEIDTLQRPTEIIRSVLSPRPVAALSGPSIAGELARKLPCTMVTAAREPSGNPDGSEALALWIQELFTTPYLRIYRNADLLGVELAGALKNVIAIAAGILDGMRAGNNAKAALLSRGLVEITRLGTALGAAPETFVGLAGLGDLVTTCVSPEGRNRSFGERIGRGEKPDDILKSIVGVVEGMPTCRSVVRWAQQKNITMPICEALYGVLFEGRDLRSQLADLMAREPKSETQ
jgi:glycerol-3-phosphate dehydrogenase (NAD(P)+)